MDQFESTVWICIFFVCSGAGSFELQKPIRPNGGISMNQMSPEQELKSNSYPGRGIVIGYSDDGARAVAAYFIMDKSANSRNRMFVVDGEGARAQASNPAKLEDPSLTIYAPVWTLGNKTIMTNGNQIDIIYDGMDHQIASEQPLRYREFEPSAPDYTPRVPDILHIENGNYNCIMSILKSDNTNPDSCLRFTYVHQSPAAGERRFIHTYMRDGNPPPSFEGEPKKMGISGDIDAFTDSVWSDPNGDNKVLLLVRYIDIAVGTYEMKIVSRNK